jgi:hypothetical protein
MPEIRHGSLVMHEGSCECVRRAYHLEGAGGEFQGVVYSEERAGMMVAYFQRNGISVVVVPKDILTQALHVDGIVL